MALKNSTGYRVTTRDLTSVCDPDKFRAEDVRPVIIFKGIQDNKIVAGINIEMTVNGYEVVLTGEPQISLNHFELRLTGNSAKISPEEREKLERRIEKYKKILATGSLIIDDDGSDPEDDLN